MPTPPGLPRATSSGISERALSRSKLSAPPTSSPGTSYDFVSSSHLNGTGRSGDVAWLAGVLAKCE